MLTGQITDRGNQKKCNIPEILNSSTQQSQGVKLCSISFDTKNKPEPATH